MCEICYNYLMGMYAITRVTLHNTRTIGEGHM